MHHVIVYGTPHTKTPKQPNEKVKYNNFKDILRDKND